MKKLNKLINIYSNIETSKDLKKYNLSLNDYQILYCVIYELQKKKTSITINYNVMQLCKKLNFNIKNKNGLYKIIAD